MSKWTENEHLREYHRERRRRLKKERPEYILFLSAKSRAKMNNIEFNIKEADIVIPKLCPILGLELQVSDTIREDNSPSLDRIDPNKGYIKGNVQVISWRANNLKRDATLQELHAFAKYFYENNITELG